ncbi:hypothetical protein CKAN_02583200 [Cinnamomum micranthum f. kanehirae]|uniref:Uncharacterized protein n=1 Tax=Cinnamomum micranthum f. kanehirae TaxID=337451 RepID=A0A443Q0B6_9MAGN|nr:hypothetical protein CKAN_02583200 [Cinnamomum micranthum f. kanehirae]
MEFPLPRSVWERGSGGGFPLGFLLTHAPKNMQEDSSSSLSQIKWKSQPSSGDKLKMEGNYDGILEEAVFGVSNDTIKWKSQPSSGDKLKMVGNTDGILEEAVFGASNDIRIYSSSNF